MTFPVGWQQRIALTIDNTRVTGNPVGFVLLIALEMLPTNMVDAGAVSAQDGGGDIRVTNDAAGTQRLPIDVAAFRTSAVPGNRRCEIWVNMAGFEPTSAAPKTIYVWWRGPTIVHQPAPSQPFGAEATWATNDYRGVHHMNDAPVREAAGLWLIRPKAVERAGVVYLCWLDFLSASPGNIRISSYTIATGVWSPAVTVAPALIKDAHGAPSICIDNSGFIHLTYGSFGLGPLRTVRSLNPGDISAWRATVDISTGITEATYPCMFALASGTLVVFSREADNWVRRLSTDGGLTWGSPHTVISGERSYPEWVLGAGDRVHVAWHTTASSGSINGLDISYIYTDNPAAATPTWRAVDGTAAVTPVPSNGPSSVSTGLVFDISATSFTTSYLIGLAVNASNVPIVAAGLFSSGTPANNTAAAFTFAAGAWTTRTIVTNADVGLAATPNRRMDGGVRWLTGTTWRALVSRTIGGIGEIQEWQSTNDGANWVKVTDVTQNSSLGNYQAQYVRGATGPVIGTSFSSDLANVSGAAFNVSADIWFFGDATDDVASEAQGALPLTGFLRDSTRYHNDATNVSGAGLITTPFAFGGFARSFVSPNTTTLVNSASINAQLKAAVQIQYWGSHTSGGSGEKPTNQDSSAGAAAPWNLFRDGSNNLVAFFGNGTTFIAPTTAGGAGATSAYRYVARYAAGFGSARLNKVAVAPIAMTGPLATNASQVRIGDTMTGTLDEWRITPTQLSTDTLDTEYDNQSDPSRFASSGPAPVGSFAGQPRLSITRRIGIG